MKYFKRKNMALCFELEIIADLGNKTHSPF